MSNFLKRLAFKAHEDDNVLALTVGNNETQKITDKHDFFLNLQQHAECFPWAQRLTIQTRQTALTKKTTCAHQTHTRIYSHYGF